MLWSISGIIVIGLFCVTTPPTHPSLFLISKGFLITLLNDSDFALDMSMFHHELLFKHETARDRGSTFKILQKHVCPEGRDTLCKLDTLWIIAVCSAPRETQSHQPQAPGQICNRSLNSPKPRVRLGDFFICPFNTSTAHRTWIQRSIFPKLQIFRLWLLVSSTVNTAKVYQKIKYYCLSSWPFITE